MGFMSRKREILNGIKRKTIQRFRENESNHKLSEGSDEGRQVGW